MIKTEFKRIAENENGKFYYHDKDIAIGAGVRTPNVIFLIKFRYKENEIAVMNRCGTGYVGKIICQFPIA